MSGGERTSGSADTFPKLLIENARRFGDRPAIREKDFGIWQAWTWGQMKDEIAAMTAGLHAFGFKRGERRVITTRVAIVRTGSPHLE